MNNYKYIANNNHPWSDYVPDCEEDNVSTTEDDWWAEIASNIPEGAIVTDDGIIVNC